MRFFIDKIGEYMKVADNLYFIFLAIILVIIIPAILSKSGLKSSALIRILFGNLRKKESNTLINYSLKEKKVPHSENGNKSELIELIAILLRYAKKHKISLIYPGTLKYNNNITNLLAIIITKSKVIGVNCFGFGGIIIKKTNDKNSDWFQHINGEDKKIPSPINLSNKQYDILRLYMDENNMKDIPLIIASVFTNRNVNMVDYSNIKVYTQERFLNYLDSISLEDKGHDTDEIAKRINENIIRIKK